jgi:serine/threonine protein kinase
MTERFTLLSELGRGGMGVVWKARDEETGSIVALKLLREAYAEDPEYLARFERELELARRIDSIHVVKVLGFGVRERLPYLALEYVDGPSLHDALIAHGPYSWAETRSLLIQLTQGLADANAAGVIHRDVKPSNVLIGPDGVAKLTDFGIARGLDLTRFTATSTILGTPAYLAPEGPKDARSDLYSLGIIGYELLTGAVPFKGASYQEVIVEHIRTAPDLDKLPAQARPIIGWLLAKDPADRPQRASDLLPVLYGAAAVPTLPHRPTGDVPLSRPVPADLPALPSAAPAPQGRSESEPIHSGISLPPRMERPLRPNTSELAEIWARAEGLKSLGPESALPLGGWLILGGAIVAAASFLLPWVTVSSSYGPLYASGSYVAGSSYGPLVAGGSYFAGGMGTQFGSAGSIANSVYLLLGAAVAGWLAWALLTQAGRIRDLRLLLGGLAAGAGVLILVVMVAVMQTATGMLDAYHAAGGDATIDLGIGTLAAMGGGAVIIVGALIAMASEPATAPPTPDPTSNPLGGWLVLGGAVVAAASFLLPWVTVSSPSGSLVWSGSYFAGGMGPESGSAGSIANSVYLLLGAAVAGWLAWVLLTDAGRGRDLSFLLGGLAAGAGVLILVVMVAVMQSATGIFDTYQAAGVQSTTIALSIGTLAALGGGVVIIVGALVAMASEPGEMWRRWLSAWTESWR